MSVFKENKCSFDVNMALDMKRTLGFAGLSQVARVIFIMWL